MFYITQQDLQNYKGITLTGNGVNTFNFLQQNMQDTVDRYCNRTWNITNPITEYFDAMSSQGGSLTPSYDFYPSNPPSKTPFNPTYPLAGGVQSITIGGSTVDMQYVINYGSIIRLSAAFPSVLLANPLGYKAVQIVYNSDDAGNVPTPIKQALVEWMGKKIDTASDNNKDTKEVMTGSIRYYFKEDTLGAVPDFVKYVLDMYRLMPIDRF